MSLLRRLILVIPITFGGTALLIFGLFLVNKYSAQQSDLVADMIGRTIVGTVIVSVLFNIYIGFKLRRHTKIQTSFGGPGLSSGAFSTKNELFYSLQNVSLPILFQLKVIPRFDRPNVSAASHLVSGREDPPTAPRYLIDRDVTFKHRGIWNLTSVRFVLSDVFNIGRFAWEVENSLELDISAANLSTSPVPIVASNYREGDLVQAFDRSGEPYDLKPYDPSEGVRRVIWKIYAKTGQLITRRPEPSHIPDGEVCVYLVAKPEDDHVAGALQHFLERLVAEDTGFIFGADGLSDNDFAELIRITTTDLEQAVPHTRREINGVVWNPLSGSGRGIGAFLKQLSSVNKSVSEIVLFGSTDDAWIEKVRTQIPVTIRATYIVVPNPSVKAAPLKRSTIDEERLVHLEVQPQML